MDLLSQLVNTLGISEDQARGGAGLLFRLAQEKLADGDFSELGNRVSGMDDMMAAAPAPQDTGLLGAVGGVLSSFGGGAGALGSLASLAGGFDKLGLDSGMIQRFLPVILDFLQQQGAEGLVDKLRDVLGGR
jgi:hypothetical protein